MEVAWENFKILLGLYYRPQRAISNIIDHGSWLFGAVAVVAISLVFQFAINSRLNDAYGVPGFDFEKYRSHTESAPDMETLSREEYEAEYRVALENYQKAVRERQKLPLVGDYGLWFFNFNSINFLGLLLGLVIFYVPATILLLTLFEPIGSFGLVLRRDYGVLLACTLLAWAAAHLPFAVIGLMLKNQAVSPNILLAMWLASGLWFGVLMIFALRTIFGAGWTSAIATVCLSWLSISLGGRVFNYISPYLFSPFLLFLAYAYFRGEAATMSNAYRQRQNFRRFLNNATLNPHDAEARVQLGLIYKQRRQTEEAAKYFNEALAIDPQEIDANYEMRKIAREQNDLQKALEHFSIVAEQNDRYATDEIWREIGATYLDAKAYKEARQFLEKFVERRPYDPEGLYLLGQTLKNLGETQSAAEMFRRSIEAVQTSPEYRRGFQRKWAKLAQKEMR